MFFRQRLIVIVVLLLSVCGCNKSYRNLTWSWGPTAPMARTSRATVAVKDKIITAGGTYWVDDKDGKVVKIWSSEVFQLNINDMKWKRLPDYPIPAGYAFAVSIGNKVYVVGGRSNTRSNAETFVIDLSENDPSWSPGPSLPLPRYGHVGGTIGSVIYIAGGTQGDLSQKDENTSKPNVIALNTKNLEKGWQYIAELPNAKTQWQYGTTCGQKLYLFGGIVKESVPEKTITPQGTPRVDENNLLPYVPQYDVFSMDVKTGQWTTLNPMPVAKLSGSCIALDDSSILIVGGVDMAIPASQTPDKRPRINFSPQCYLYNTTTDSYKLISLLKKGVGDQGLAYIDGIVYVIAGEANPFKTRTDLVQIGRF